MDIPPGSLTLKLESAGAWLARGVPSSHLEDEDQNHAKSTNMTRIYKDVKNFDMFFLGMISTSETYLEKYLENIIFVIGPRVPQFPPDLALLPA